MEQNNWFLFGGICGEGGILKDFRVKNMILFEFWAYDTILS